MRTRYRAGGIGALVAAATFVIGLAMFATMLLDYTTATAPSEAVAFLVDHRAALTVWNLLITIVFGIALVPLVLALHDRLRAAAPGLSRTASVFGLIWVGLIIATGMILNVGYGSVLDLHVEDPDAAATVWAGVDIVANGLGGGNEIVGGVWVLLVTLAAWRTKLIPSWLNGFGLGAAASGLVTVLPGLSSLGAVFGIGLIVWFVGVGIVLLRSAGDVSGVAAVRAGTGDRAAR
jgi:hypothetical protein